MNDLKEMSKRPPNPARIQSIQRTQEYMKLLERINKAIKKKLTPTEIESFIRQLKEFQ